MGKKLNFLFTSKLWRSRLFKTLFFGLVLFGVWFLSARGESAFGGEFSFLTLLIFVLSVFWLYFSQLPERRYFRFSFIILVLTALLALRFNVFFGILIFSFLFYLFLGLTDFSFKNPNSVYLFINTCLFLIVFLFSFGVGKSEYFLLINLLLFLIVFLLLRECFRNSLFIIHNSVFRSLVIAFLSLELFWAIHLLPLGFINSAILLTLFIFLMRDFVLAYSAGRLNRRFIASHLVIFLVLAVLIFIFSKWSI